MESATITKVTLRQEKLRSGKLSLYLDYYPPIWNPHIKKMSRREFLGLYLIGKPKDKFELDYNEEILLKARGIRATRELAIINEEFGFLDRTKKQADFLEYFESKTKVKYQKWEIVYKHFKDFCNGRCLIKDVTIGLCNDFRTYILKIRVKQSGNIISRNSAAGYWSTFRALLKLAYKEGWLRENVNDYLDRIDWEEPKNQLSRNRGGETPCRHSLQSGCTKTGIALRLHDRAAHQRYSTTPLGEYRSVTRRRLLYAHPYPEDQDAGDIAVERRSSVVLWRTWPWHGIQGIEPSPYTRAVQEVAQRCRHQEENYLPRSTSHLRYTVDNQRYRYLHRQQDAHA